MRRIIFKWRNSSRFVAAGRFDLHDVGAHVGDELGAMKAQRASEIQNPVAGERWGLINVCHDAFLLETFCFVLSTVTSDRGMLSRHCGNLFKLDYSSLEVVPKKITTATEGMRRCNV